MERISEFKKPVQKYEWPKPDCDATPARAIIVGGMVVEETRVIPVHIDRRTGRVVGHR